MNIRTAPEQIDRSDPVPDRSADRPPFEAGDHLSRAEFERRYHAYPEIKKAELIEGVVHMPSPARHAQHGNPHFKIITWLGTYCAATPRTDGGDNSTLRLDNENEVQPDALLRLEEAAGGHSTVSADDYLEGSPELVIEIAASSASYDLHEKRRIYARNGVQEYLVLQMYEQRVIWYILRDGVYETLQPDEEGTLRSTVFPGLWLQADAIWSADLATLLTTLQKGLASPEHATFAARLQSTIK